MRRGGERWQAGGRWQVAWRVVGRAHGGNTWALSWFMPAGARQTALRPFSPRYLSHARLSSLAPPPPHPPNPPENVHLLVVFGAQQHLGGHVRQRPRLARHVVLLAFLQRLESRLLAARQARRRCQPRPARGECGAWLAQASICACVCGRATVGAAALWLVHAGRPPSATATLCQPQSSSLEQRAMLPARQLPRPAQAVRRGIGVHAQAGVGSVLQAAVMLGGVGGGRGGAADRFLLPTRWGVGGGSWG